VGLGSGNGRNRLGRKEDFGFTILLNSGNQYDLPVTPGTVYNVGVAYVADGADAFIPKHAVRVLIQQAF